MRLDDPDDTIVIGAGLSAATELRGRDIPVVIREASDRVAALWRACHPQARLKFHHRLALIPTGRCSS